VLENSKTNKNLLDNMQDGQIPSQLLGLRQQYSGLCQYTDIGVSSKFLLLGHQEIHAMEQQKKML